MDGEKGAEKCTHARTHCGAVHFTDMALSDAKAKATDAAKPFLERALQINGKLGRIHFFKAMTENADGDYDAALKSLRITESMYPRDRVVLNQIGRVQFLERRFDEAIASFSRTLAVDPEDLEAHYNLMLCYQGKGDLAGGARERTLYTRFKADEAAQAITGPYRLKSPEDNNERQLIHEHR